MKIDYNTFELLKKHFNHCTNVVLNTDNNIFIIEYNTIALYLIINQKALFNYNVKIEKSFIDVNIDSSFTEYEIKSTINITNDLIRQYELNDFDINVIIDDSHEHDMQYISYIRECLDKCINITDYTLLFD